MWFGAILSVLLILMFVWSLYGDLNEELNEFEEEVMNGEHHP